MASVIKKMIDDVEQLDTSIPRIKQILEENPAIYKDALLLFALEHYHSLARFKPHYFEIIKLFLPYSTYRIHTKDDDLATYLLDQGKDFRYKGSDTHIKERVDSTVFHLSPELFFPPEPMHGNYVFIGHGSDTGTPTIVPPGCIYVVATLCGEISYVNIKYPNFLAADKDALVHYAREGDTDALQRELKFPCTIYKEGEEITDVMFHLPPIYHELDKPVNKFVLPGGLIPIKDMRYHLVENSGRLVQDTYSSSVFPSRKIIPYVDAMNQTELSKYVIHVPLSDLFHHYPGIHFMLVCRVNPPGSESPVKRRRTKSLDRYKTYTLETLRQMDEPTLQEVIQSPCYFIQEDGLEEFLSSKTDIHRLKGRIISRGGMKQKTVCKNVTRNIRTGKTSKKVTRICNDKYREMYQFNVKGYFRDDNKSCYENHRGINMPYTPRFTKKNCGWYLNDKEKLSDDFRFINKENNIVWREN